MTAKWSAVASSRVERWIAAAAVHSLCSVVEKEHPRAESSRRRRRSSSRRRRGTRSESSRVERQEEEEEEEIERQEEEEENTESLAELLRDQLRHLMIGK